MEDVSLEELLNSFEKLDDLMQSMLKKKAAAMKEKKIASPTKRLSGKNHLTV